MKVYTEEFEAMPHPIYPRKAVTYDSLAAAKKAYADFIEDCDRYGARPGNAAVYVGTPEGNEETYGYPYHPDYLLSPGPRGGIRVKKLG